MAPNRITRGGATLAALLLIALLAGCGGGGTSVSTAAAVSSQGSPDAELLDKVLARQEAAADAYSKVIPELSPALAKRALYFRRQEEEHIDASIKALRGLDAPAEPTVEPIEPGELKSEREVLDFLYEVESATIDEELSAISKLEAAWPRSLLASTVANQAQHLTLLRQALGAGPLASAALPFENGTAPPPE
jgi:Ferritin-like domain